MNELIEGVLKIWATSIMALLFAITAMIPIAVILGGIYWLLYWIFH